MKDKIKEIIVAIVEENKVKRNGRDYALLVEVKIAIGVELKNNSN